LAKRASAFTSAFFIKVAKLAKKRIFSRSYFFTMVVGKNDWLKKWLVDKITQHQNDDFKQFSCNQYTFSLIGHP